LHSGKSGLFGGHSRFAMSGYMCFLEGWRYNGGTKGQDLGFDSPGTPAPKQNWANNRQNQVNKALPLSLKSKMAPKTTKGTESRHPREEDDDHFI
jgi:hypothetical protein